MTYMNPSDENKIKSDIFSWEILKSDIILLWLQNNEIFQFFFN